MPTDTAEVDTNFDSFVNKIEDLTKEDILSDETFVEVFIQDNEVYRQQLINKLRNKAKELHVSMKSFDETLTAHRAFKKSRERENQIEKHKLITAMRNDPDWYLEGNIDEVKFCQELTVCRSMKCINGVLYDTDGIIPDDKMENDIHTLISPYINKKIASKVKELINALKMVTYSLSPQPDKHHINLLNGTLNIDGTFMPITEFCLNRLNVEYKDDSPEPQSWINFVNDLLHPGDVLTLQEYLGYCLIPSTKAQAMLFLIGNGGEGKSRIGVVLNQIFKNSMVSGCLQDLEENKFTLASLENKLLFLDDDLSIKASEDSKNLKKIVTAESPILVERKGVQAYESLLYSRLLAFGNCSLRMLFDHSDGMFRRQIILKVKPKPADRVDDHFLIEKLIAEKDSIFNWCFEGLQRLIANQFQFTISEQAKINLEEARQENCNVIRFLTDESFVIVDDLHYCITCENLMMLYEYWCRMNAETPLKRTSVINYLKSNSDKYGIRYNFNVINDRGKRVRGFDGMKQAVKFENVGVLDDINSV